MNKKICLIVIFLTLFVCVPNIKASDVNAYVTTSDVLIASEANKEKPNNSCYYKENGRYSSIYASPNNLHCLDSGEEVIILNYEQNIPSTVESCKQGFYNVLFTSGSSRYTGYVCADYLKTKVSVDEYAEEFASAGFPESYWERLALLKSIHPNWKFTGYKTNLNWNDVISNESEVGMSYIQNTNPLYLSLEESSYNPSNNMYNQMEPGGWYAANKQTVAYYMDPRNFLNEMNIFMFENLGYNEAYQTKEVIDNIFAGTELLDYSDYFMQAATYKGNNISPISLAARARQEVISNGKLTNSANGQGTIAGNVYYNFYNIGAFSSCTDPIACALDFAKGYDENYTTYERPWTTPEKAILNGAQYLADGYINAGQNTFYLQKFNVTPNNTYSHQYMTNIEAPISESKSSYKAYKNIGKLDSTIEFLIPIYNDMPSQISTLPISVDKNTIDDLKNNTTITEVITKSGFTDNGQYITNISIGYTAAHMINAIKSSGGEVSITTDGKPISGQEKLGTGDIINITVNGETKSYRIVIRGDASGDGEVDAIDYVKVYKYIMGGASLNGSYEIASDVNNDGSVDAVDYVKLYKYIMDGGSL